jgi:hypothetical protein
VTNLVAQWADVFSMDHLHWARATFDSRAFHLNVDGTVCMALVPIADMINHSTRNADVLVRVVLPNGGNFEMHVGAALSEVDVGRQLVMSYGFIEDGDNENDRIPFPILLEDRALESQDEYVRRRWSLLDHYGLTSGKDFWIGHDGVPPPALLAVLRIQMAEVPQLEYFEVSPYAVFRSRDTALEAAVVDTIAATVDAISSEFTTTLADDEEMIRTGLRHDQVDQDDEEDNRGPFVPLNGNALIAIKLRINLKRILRRTEMWVLRHRN